MMHKSYDATNAFACGPNMDLEACVRALLEEDEEIEDSDLAHATMVTRTRRERLTVILDTADDRVAIRSGSANLLEQALDGLQRLGGGAGSPFDRLRPSFPAGWFLQVPGTRLVLR